MMGQDLVDKLENQYGIVYTKKGEIECKLMRIESRIEICLARNLDATSLYETMNRLVQKRESFVNDLARIEQSIADTRLEFGMEVPKPLADPAPMAHSIQLGMKLE